MLLDRGPASLPGNPATPYPNGWARLAGSGQPFDVVISQIYPNVGHLDISIICEITNN